MVECRRIFQSVSGATGQKSMRRECHCTPISVYRVFVKLIGRFSLCSELSPLPEWYGRRYLRRPTCPGSATPGQWYRFSSPRQIGPRLGCRYSCSKILEMSPAFVDPRCGFPWDATPSYALSLVAGLYCPVQPFCLRANALVVRLQVEGLGGGRGVLQYIMDWGKGSSPVQMNQSSTQATRQADSTDRFPERMSLESRTNETPR